MQPKNVLIISPYFPPTNAADMQRIRMSLPYFSEFGWNAEVVTVDEAYSDLVKDELLCQSIPGFIKIHRVKAFAKSWTSKLGLGSIALRSIYFYRKKVNWILENKKIDLIYFSTTQFPVCILGPYWKKRFNIPYVIDMQDPWHSNYYLDKPKEQRPPKYWFSYHLNKTLEPLALKNAGGLISVSANYITDLHARYLALRDRPAATITFGAFAPDLQIAQQHQASFSTLLDSNTLNIVYIGRGGADMHQAITPLFKVFKDVLAGPDKRMHQLKFYFIGTSYAPAGQGKQTVMPIARQYGIEANVVEITNRISYYHSLLTLQQASALFIPGSNDPKYTASKIYPYLLVNKPLLAIFNKQSSAIAILKEYGVKNVYNYEDVDTTSILNFFKDIVECKLLATNYNKSAVEKYSAREMTLQQCRLFDKVMNGKN